MKLMLLYYYQTNSIISEDTLFYSSLEKNINKAKIKKEHKKRNFVHLIYGDIEYALFDDIVEKFSIFDIITSLSKLFMITI